MAGRSNQEYEPIVSRSVDNAGVRASSVAVKNSMHVSILAMPERAVKDGKRSVTKAAPIGLSPLFRPGRIPHRLCEK